MRERQDLVGQRFGKLVVSEFIGKCGRKRKHFMWDCICDCGNTTKVFGGNLKSGHTVSCGCSKGRPITHGQNMVGLRTLVYICWCTMMQRCYNPNSTGYKYWGGRGIRVCERWHSFENFYEDMGDCPSGMTLDRKDNDVDYCKENCRWATDEEQANNKSSNVWYEHDGLRKTISQWARHLGIRVGTLGMRLTSGWSVERALTTPVKVHNKKLGLQTSAIKN